MSNEPEEELSTRELFMVLQRAVVELEVSFVTGQAGRFGGLVREIHRSTDELHMIVVNMIKQHQEKINGSKETTQHEGNGNPKGSEDSQEQPGSEAVS